MSAVPGSIMTRFVQLGLLLCAVCMATTAVWAADTNSDLRFEAARRRMVALQIADRGIKNEKVLDAMRKVRRHDYVPQALHDRAYDDTPLPIGEGQTISQPYIVALMTEVLNPDSTMKVLEIGTGSGYQAAVLAELCDSVYTIEIIEKLGRRAEQALNQAGYTNVLVRIGDGYLGWEEHAPFDAIIVTCAPSHVPRPLVEQLREGGTMVIPMGEAGVQELVLLTKKDGEVVKNSIIPVRFVPMVDQTGKTY